MMRRISWRKVGAPGGRHSLAGAVGVALVSVLAAAAPALGDTQTRNLTIHTVGPPQSEDVTCLVPGPDDSCTDAPDQRNPHRNEQPRRQGDISDHGDLKLLRRRLRQRG